MPRPRTFLCSLVAVWATGFALAVPQEGGNAQAPARRPGTDLTRAQAPAQPAGIDMNELLGLWERQSAKLKTLEVKIYRIDKNPAWWDEEEHFVGQAAFKSPHLAFLEFRRVKMQAQVDPQDKNKRKMVPLQKNGQIESTPYQTIVCTGPEIWDYHYDVEEIYTFTLDNDSRRRAIEEGPLPFLFNLKASEANQRYQMTLKGQDADRYLVMIMPRLKEEKERFSVAWIYLDRKYLLPTRIVLIAPDRKSSQDFRLSNISANNPVDARKFASVNPPGDARKFGVLNHGKPWKVVRNPGELGPAAPANARARLRQPEQN